MNSLLIWYWWNKEVFTKAHSEREIRIQLEVDILYTRYNFITVEEHNALLR